MTTKESSKAPKKRRSVSKARLYKEIEATTKEKGLTGSGLISELLEALKDDIVTEALK